MSLRRIVASSSLFVVGALLLSQSITEPKYENKTQDIQLSNGMTVPSYRHVRTDTLEGEVKYLIDTGMGPLEIYDKGDGKPYHMVESGYRVYEGDSTVKDNMDTIPSFDLTYTSGDSTYPIWEPLAFRNNPAYIEFGKKLQRQLERDLEKELTRQKREGKTNI